MPTTLVIDDDGSFEDLCRACNKRAGKFGIHRFVFARNDSQALSTLSAHDDLDVAIVSLDGGAVSGLDIFQQLQGRRIRVPRIAVTKGGELATIRAAMKKGAVDFLTKPVEADDLLATIDKVFADTERRRKAWSTEANLSALRRELDIAGEIQSRILPQKSPNNPDLEIAAKLIPARRMSGDFYDFFDIDEQRIGVAMADVSGKGIPAAFFMAVARTLLRSIAMEGRSPGQTLSLVNHHLSAHGISNMFVSIFYGILNTKTWNFSYCNGGHLPPYHLRGGDLSAVALDDAGGPVLGFQHDIPYEEATITLERDDGIFFYTDGITEAFDEQRNQFSEERLVSYLLENRSLSAHAMAENVFAFINMFTGEAEQSDDITSLVIKRF